MPDPEMIPVESIKRLDVRPGDTLVVTVPDDTDPKTFNLIADAFDGRMPDDVKVVVVTAGIEMQVVTPEGGGDRE